MRFILLFVFVSAGFITLSAQVPAFPGAEGFGMYASGGRGGRVVEVTNLADLDSTGQTVPGSFRAALSDNGTDPIIIVFKVSGLIKLNSKDLRSKRSNMTIAGQTAPGDGICISHGTLKLSGNNLIIRFIRFRIGDEAKISLSGFDIENSKHVIVDHCSFSWSVEENMTFYDNKYTSVQWCLLAEGLYKSYNAKGVRAYGAQWGGQYASFHHNLIANCNSRSPRVNGCRAHDTVALCDFRNNVIANWGTSGAIYGGEVEINSPIALCHVNWVNNYYKPGVATHQPYLFAAPTYESHEGLAKSYARWFVSGNFMEGDSQGLNTDNWKGINTQKVGSKENIFSAIEFQVAPIKTNTAHEASRLVLAYAGAIFPKRDAVDTRILDQINGAHPIGGNTYGQQTGIIDSQTEVGGWPEYRTGIAPVDSDGDGMPDDWETKKGLNSHNRMDGQLIGADGYSNLEHYLNEIVENGTIKFN